MEKFNQQKYIILIILVLGFSFYWYSYRPEQIRKNCYKYVENREYIVDSSFIPGSIGDVDSLNKQMYEKCLLEKGLNN